MESSVFGTPATVPPEQEQTASAEQQTPPAEQTQQAAPPQQQAEQQQAPAENEQSDVMNAIDELRQRVDQALAPHQQAEPALDLLAALQQESEAETQVEQVEQQDQAQGVEGEGNSQQELDELRRFVRAEAQEMVRPWMQEQAEREIREIPKEFPDILSKEVLPDLERTVEDFIRDTGDDSLRFNADFIRRAYKLVKAEQAEASAVPAEQVATQGASLETNAGQTQAGAPLPDDKYKSAVYGDPGKRSVFAG